jgi:hypothetical protein
MTPEFNEKFQVFFKGCEKIYNDNHKRLGYAESGKSTFEYTVGRRYVKVIAVLGNVQRSVHCFVDMKNGDVLKAAGWNKPAKGARGNINDYANGLGRMTPYGAAYNR